MRRKFLKSACYAVLAVLFLFNGCKKEEEASSPLLPPLSAFSMDVDEFTPTKSAEYIPTNYQLAVFAFNYWNSVLAANLIIPVLVYGEALEQEPIEVADNKWLWSFSVSNGDATYTAELFGEIAGDSVEVEMYITQEGGFENFLWFTGVFDRDRTIGRWTIYDDPETPEEWLSIVWHHNWSDNTYDIKYEVTLAGNPYEGSYIEAAKTEDPVYDFIYNVYDSNADELYAIELNTATHAGRIQYNLAWHCWDAGHADIVCP
jgi:hypothetical protein